MATCFALPSFGIVQYRRVLPNCGGVGIKRITSNHLEVVSNKTVHIKSLYRNLITFFLSF